MTRCIKCSKDEMITYMFEGNPYCYDCLQNLIRDEDFLKKLLKKKYPDKDWDNIKINIK